MPKGAKIETKGRQRGWRF